MSRIIVKQLPKTITEANLRSVFGSKGTITDLQLKYTPEGKFRRFAFVGYRTAEEAHKAVEFFDNTCIQTSRIRVESCAALGSSANPSKSKHSVGESGEKSSRNDTTAKATDHHKSTDKKEQKISKLDEIIGEHKNDPEFHEFLKAHDKKRTLWGNDAPEGLMAELDDSVKNDSKKAQAKQADKLVKNKPQQNIEQDDDDGTEVGNEADTEDLAVATKLAEKPISDLEYMKSLMAGEGNSAPKEDQPKVKKAKSTKTKTGKSTPTDTELFTVKIYNVPYKVKRQDMLKFLLPLKPHSVRLPQKVRGFCYVGFKTIQEVEKAMATKHKSFIRGKQVFFSDFTERNKVTMARNKGEDVEGDSGAKKDQKGSNRKWAYQEAQLEQKGEDIADTGRMFFRNLAYTITEEELQAMFERFGPVTEVHLPVDTVTRQIKGYGTVTFMMPEHAVRAFNELDGTDFHGRLLHLMPAKASRGDDDDLLENDAGLSFKQKKALQLKKTAHQPNAWNTLFLGANAVANLMARKYDTSKAHILDTEAGGSSAAVRIALGETQLVVEMKRFLEEHGVCLEAFAVDPTTLKRSKTIILAKNLSADTTVSELTPLFAKFGPLARVVLPPSGVTALIEFADSAEARRAFRCLAFSKFKSLPLFLEWAPENVFRTTADGVPIPRAELPTSEKSTDEDKPKIENNDNDGENDEEDLTNVEPEANTTLFLHNLNFKTEEQTIKDHFSHLGPIHSVDIARRKDANDPRKLNSLGYGFIQFKLADTAAKALKQMQFTTIEEKQVELKRSDRILKGAEDKQTARKKTAAGKQTGSKILVRNIPFQATAKEVREIFKAFGEIRTLRLPLKMTPGETAHRGFGFVDYVTKNDAKQAFNALSQSTHLYGRRLVLEWATLDETVDLDELRKRTAEQYRQTNAGSMDGAKRSRRAVFDADMVAADEGEE